MSFRLARATALALPLLLAACVTVPPSPPAVPAITTKRDFYPAIDIGGRLSVHYQVNDRNEAVHGSFTWSQTPDRITVTLLSPLGQTVAVIDVDAEGATLRQAGRIERSAPSVDALTADALGWPLPVAGLRDWLQGFALEGSGKRRTATPSHAQINSPDGWRINYAAWLVDDPSSPQSRPRRIDLERHTEQAGDVSLRIVIDTWQPR